MLRVVLLGTVVLGLAGVGCAARQRSPEGRELAVGVAQHPAGMPGEDRVSEPASFRIAAVGVAQAVIVVEPDAGRVAGYAARELQSYVGRVSGALLPIQSTLPTHGNAILVGLSRVAAANGLDVTRLKRDGFVLRRRGRLLFIAGRDDPGFDLQSYVECRPEPPHGGRGYRWQDGATPEIATEFAVCGFLERFAGVRWYFPGPQGEVVPRRPDLAVGEVDITDEPAMSCRSIRTVGGQAGKPVWGMADYVAMGIGNPEGTLWAVRNRASTVRIPMNHLPSDLRWAERFGQTHPEYFALRADGQRANRTGSAADGNPGEELCYSQPDVRRIVAADATVFFSGEKATAVQRAPPDLEWPRDVAHDAYFSILPQDGSQGCHCPRCAARRLPDLPAGEQSRLVWEFARAVAEQVRDRYPDKRLVLLAYGQSRAMPPGLTPLPANLLVGVTAVHLGGSADNATMARIIGEIRAWRAMTPNRLTLWSYQIVRPAYDGIPQTQVRATARFVREVRDDIQGIVLENLMTRGFQHHLDLYVYLRLLWDPDADVEAILREYAELMYGPAADEVLQMLTTTEDRWINGIARHDRPQMGGAAYQDIVDIPEERWANGIAGLTAEVYTPAVMSHLAALADRIRAKRAAWERPECTDLFLRHFWDPLRTACEKTP